ncbi:MAG TPA: HD domain-containing protein [Solirubrobacteraceae bacterium]|nr:HD domain-containing protein [Solirubrobacteraceae bacterium]
MLCQASGLEASALEYAEACHAGQRRDSDGAPFIEHPVEVARLLREAGCSQDVVAAGLLHDVVEDTVVTLDDVRARFGANVAALVAAVTDDPGLAGYRQRKRGLREQVREAGGDAALLFAADKISRARELADDDRPDRPQRLEHYRASLGMLEHVAPHHPLVRRLADELAGT